MNLFKLIQLKLRKRDGTGPNRCIDKVEAGSGAGGECGPGMHRHPDVYSNKCHPIEQHHRKKDYRPKKKDTGDMTIKIPKPKKLKLKKLQLGRPL